MKNIFFLNNAILILLSLSSCTQESFTGNKLPLQATDVIGCRSTSSQKSQSGSNKADTLFCQVCWKLHSIWNVHPSPRLEKETLLLYYSPVFAEEAWHVINKRDPLGDINEYLKNIKDEPYAYALFYLFSLNFGKYDQKSKEEQDNIWANFLKIIGIEEELPKIASKLIQVAKALEQKKDEIEKNFSSSSPIHLNFLIYYNEFRVLEGVINTSYVNTSIDFLKGDKKFIELLRNSLNLIKGLSIFLEKSKISLFQSNQENYLLVLQKDIELFKKFFETVKFRKDLY